MELENPFDDNLLNIKEEQKGAPKKHKKVEQNLKAAINNLTIGGRKTSRNSSNSSRSDKNLNAALEIFTVNQTTPKPSLEIEDVDNVQYDNSTKKIPKKKTNDITGLIGLESNFINFGTFYPGKILKCNLCVKNNTGHDRSIYVSIDEDAFMFKKEELDDMETELPSDIPNSIPNSEQIYHCWQFLVDPENKTFEKSVAIDLSPHDSLQLGIILKSPCITKAKTLYSVIRISLSDEDPMSSLLGNTKDAIIVIVKAEIMLPKLQCCKELYHERAGVKVIPLVIRLDILTQKIRVPFKNNGPKELDLILDVTGFPGKDPLAEYKCVPNYTSIGSNSIGYINISVNTWQNDSKKEQRVLVIRIKDTLMVYTYILDCCFVTSSNALSSI